MSIIVKPSPFHNQDWNRPLHEMTFVPTDCFKQLSSLNPGEHGWVFIFRDELKDWLLSAAQPFHVVYQDVAGKKTSYGAYEAVELPGCGMVGPEFIRLSDSVSSFLVLFTIDLYLFIGAQYHRNTYF